MSTRWTSAAFTVIASLTVAVSGQTPQPPGSRVQGQAQRANPEARGPKPEARSNARNSSPAGRS